MLTRIPPALQGILLMLASMFCFAVMAAFIRSAGTEAPTAVMVFMRNILSLLLAPFVLHKGFKGLTTARLGRHVLRSAIGIVSMHTWFQALVMMPLTQAIALSFVTPIFVTILAILALGEKAGVRRWSAIFFGFIGTLVILRPDVAGIGYGAWLVLFSSLLMAVVSILVKTLTKTEAPHLIVFYMALFMALFSLPGALYYWQPISQETFLKLFGVAFSSTLAHVMIAKAYTKADMVLLMPFDFTRLLFISAFAYAFFDELLDVWTFAGASIIVASTVYIAHREARLRRRIPSIDPEQIGR